MAKIKSKALQDSEARAERLAVERDAFRQWVIADLMRIPVQSLKCGNVSARLFGLDSACGGWIVWQEDLGDGYPFMFGDMVDAFVASIDKLEYSPNQEVQERTDRLRMIASEAHRLQREAMDRKYGKVGA